jgi:hypothetical protein
VSVGPRANDFEEALAALAGAAPDAPHGLARALDTRAGPAALAGELVVVTAALDVQMVQRLLDVALRQLVSVVWVDAPSWNGRPTRGSAGTLAFSSAGLPVSVVRRGDDLRTALAAPVPARRAVG